MTGVGRRAMSSLVALVALAGLCYGDQNGTGESSPSDPCQLQSGDAVVVRTGDERTLRGAVERLSSDAVVLGIRGESETVPRALIESLKVHAGRRGQAAKGAKIGALVWVGFTALALAGGSDESGIASWQAAAALGVSTGIGAGVGALVKTDKWKECCQLADAGRRAPSEPERR